MKANQSSTLFGAFYQHFQHLPFTCLPEPRGRERTSHYLPLSLTIVHCHDHSRFVTLPSSSSFSTSSSTSVTTSMPSPPLQKSLSSFTLFIKACNSFYTLCTYGDHPPLLQWIFFPNTYFKRLRTRWLDWARRGVLRRGGFRGREERIKFMLFWILSHQPGRLPRPGTMGIAGRVGCKQ